MYRRVAVILLQCIPQGISDFALLQLAVDFLPNLRSSSFLRLGLHQIILTGHVEIDPGLLPRMVLAMEIDYHHFRLQLANMDVNGISVVQVNPYSVKQKKELEDNSREKNDHKDPKLKPGKERKLQHILPAGRILCLHPAAEQVP